MYSSPYPKLQEDAKINQGWIIKLLHVLLPFRKMIDDAYRRYVESQSFFFVMINNDQGINVK